MTIKLLLLKSGEDIISDIHEMAIGEEESKKVIGYLLTKPCVVKMRTPNVLTDENEETQRASYQVSMYPWMPLTKDKTIPIPSDWVVTIVNPTDKLEQMYIEDVINYGKENDKNSISTEQSDSDQSD
jgi:hypothetical protein